MFEATDIKPAHADKALEHIAALYAVEEHIRTNEMKGAAKRAWRQTHSKPVDERFFQWIDKYFESAPRVRSRTDLPLPFMQTSSHVAIAA